MVHLDPLTLIQSFGYIGLFVIVFAESGLFIGFFLPGDSLLFTAGILASQGYLDIILLIPLLFIAAVLGDTFGYAFGRKVGPAIFHREDSWLFHKRHIESARMFYERHGSKTIVLARFMPIVRTFAPIVAGIGKMRYSTFLLFIEIGAALWAIGLTLLGYYLGKTIPGIDDYILPIILFIVFLSILPGIVQVLRARRKIINN